MINDTLLYFSNPQEFFDFVYSQKIDDGWRIYSGMMNSRGKSIKEKPYTKLLADTFNAKGFFRKKVSVAEIVSWIDNFLYMQRILQQIKKDIGDNLYDQIEIFFEYKIIMSKNMRIDFIIKYNDKLLLLEFRTLDRFEKIRSAWDKKKLELIIYKELMQNYIQDKKFLTYAFIGLYEYEHSKIVSKHKDYNLNQVKYLSKYAKLFMFDFKE